MNEATVETDTLQGSGDLSKDEFYCLTDRLHLNKKLQSVQRKRFSKGCFIFVTFLCSQDARAETVRYNLVLPKIIVVYCQLI